MDARFARLLFSYSLAALLCGCGGGGGGTSALPPAGPAVPAPAGAAQSIPFTIALPSPTAASGQRRSPRYVSAGTKSATIAYAGQTQIVNCANDACSALLTVPAGLITFVATLYDAPNAGGNVLAQGKTQTTIVPGQTNRIQITFSGVIASIAVALGSGSVPAGAAVTIPLTVSAKDAAGYTIVGSVPYASPIALTTDGSAAVLSASSVGAPDAAVTLRYDGSGNGAVVHVGATAPGAPAAGATLQIAGAAPGASFPEHVFAATYYGLNNVNAALPAAWMAQHVDLVEDDGYTAQSALAFKRAGGKMAIAYTDPQFVPHCSPPFTAPAGKCDGPIGDRVSSDERAWVHDASGARINHAYGSFGYQEALNVTSPVAQGAYTQTTAGILSASPLLDGFFADDSGSNFTEPSSSTGLGSNLYWGFNAPQADIRSDAAYEAGEIAMLSAAVKPVIVNGGGSYSEAPGPAYGGAFVDLPNVLGQMSEGCYDNDGGYLFTDVGDKFSRQLDGLIAVQAHRKLAICLPTGDMGPAARLYAYASWLLSYDPHYSVYQMAAGLSDGYAVWPETTIVPTQPRFTASKGAQLVRGGAYVREFAACAIAGAPIGPCATVVNPSHGSSAAVPALAIGYAHSISLDAQSRYTGGAAHVNSGVPTTLAPATAAILVQ